MALWIRFVTFIAPQCLEHYTLCFEGLTLGKKCYDIWYWFLIYIILYKLKKRLETLCQILTKTIAVICKSLGIRTILTVEIVKLFFIMSAFKFDINKMLY